MATLVLGAVYALVALTFLVGLWMGWVRTIAVRRGEVDPEYFKLNSGRIADRPAQAANNFRNLFELPVLFYVLAVLMLILDDVDVTQVVLAWLFVVTRYLHSFIHLGYNRVEHRFFAYVAGLLVLLVMWLRFAF